MSYVGAPVGLAFGEATEDDEEAYRQFQKQKYEERVQQQQMHFP